MANLKIKEIKIVFFFIFKWLELKLLSNCLRMIAKIIKKCNSTTTTTKTKLIDMCEEASNKM